FRRYDAGSHGAAKPEGVADGDDPVADLRGAALEFDIGEIALAIDLDQREVGVWVGSYDLGVILLSVIGRHFDRRCVVDDMVVRHRVAIRGNEETRTEAGDDLVLLAARRLIAELAEELLER